MSAWRSQSPVVAGLRVLGVVGLLGAQGCVQTAGAPLSLAEAAFACADAYACEAHVFMRHNHCVEALRLGQTFGLPSGPFGPEEARCVLGAGADCVAIHRCLGVLDEPGPACEPHCEGSVAVACHAGRVIGVDCADRGSTCADGRCSSIACTWSNEGTYAFGTCPAGSHCDGGCRGEGPECVQPLCDGGRARACRGGRLDEGIDCEALGAVCVRGSGGWVGCESPVRHGCIRPGRVGSVSTCHGGLLVMCATDGSEIAVSCTGRGWAGCVEYPYDDGDVGASCVPAEGRRDGRALDPYPDP